MLNEIKAALEKATPGPWHMSKLSAGYLVDDRGKDITVFIEYNEDGSVHMEFENWQNNARLIANAPEWLCFLLSELDRIEREYAEERAAHNAHVTELCELEQERNMYKASSEVFYERLKKVAEQREKLVECLRFYERLARGREVNDGGRRGRTLLAEIGVTVE